MWGMLYADDAGIVAITGRVGDDDDGDRDGVCRVRADGIGGQDGDHVPANERWGARAVHRYCSRPGYIQTVEFAYLGGAISADWDLRSVEVTRRIQRAWACFVRYKMEIYDRPSVRLRLKVRMLKAVVLETLLYGCVTWSPRKACLLYTSPSPRDS